MSYEPKPLIPYPRGILRTILRLPLLLHRLGWGALLAPAPLMILTTRGRITGLPRPVVLEYRRHGSKLYVVSGWGTRPQWYRNLQQDASVTVQLGTKARAARASQVRDSAEALRALYMFQRTSGLYDTLLASMSSADSLDLRKLADVADEFTVVRFDLREGPPPLPGVEPSLRWLGNLLLLLGAGLLLARLLWGLWRKRSD